MGQKMRNKHYHIPLFALATVVLTVLALSLSSLTSATQGVTDGRTFQDNKFSDPNIGLEDTTVDNYNVRLLLDNVSWTQTTDDDFEAGENLENMEVIGTGTDASVRIDRIGDKWTSMEDTLNTVQQGGSLVWTSGDYIYALRGIETTEFWRYSISNDNWTPMASISESVTGSSLVWTGGDNIYALLQGGGGLSNNFWRYSISDNSWSMMPDTLLEAGSHGVSAVWTGGDNIYALRGYFLNPQDDFLRFSISDNSWTSENDAPAGVSSGGSLAWGNGDYIYALRGGGENDFWRYSISDNSWTSRVDIPGPVSYGGSLVWAGVDNIYALQGDGRGFWWYIISEDRWVQMISTPDDVWKGGSLVWTGSDNIYALRGKLKKEFWRYAIPTFLYDSGTFTSAVYDTGGVASWGAITWGDDTPSGTSLTIQTRTSPDNVSWSTWVDCVNGDNVPSLENRYIQYHAIFSTSDIAITPVLHEVTINYKKYRSRGTLISQAWDSGGFISSWDNISWDADTPSGTSLTIQTRTSSNNTSWPPDWDDLGADNSIQSPDNRYLQVRATLTGDNTATSLLHEYTVHYTVQILRVTASISPSENSALPGENVSFIVTVMNIGENDDNYDLTADDNAGWSLYIENEVLEVSAGESRTTTLTVTILKNALAHTEDNILVTATSQTDDTVSDNASCIARAGVVRGVQVSISPPENEGAPGVELKYTVTIKNTGNAGDNFTLGKTQTKKWGLGLPTLVGPLGPGEDDSVTLKVLIPSDAENGTDDKITVTATSRANPSVSDNDSCIARAIIVRGVSVSISPQENNAAPNENVTFTVTVTNTGEVADDYELTVTDDAGWGAWLDVNLLEDIAPYESRQTMVSVTVPSDVIEGELTVIAVTATSQADPTVENSAECTAKAKAEEGPSGFPWLPVAAVVIVGAIIVVILVMGPFFKKPTPARFW